MNIYTWCSTFLFTPEYIGITCGTWVGVVEISIVLYIKYEQSNFGHPPTVWVLGGLLISTLAIWIGVTQTMLSSPASETATETGISTYMQRIILIGIAVGYLIVFTLMLLGAQYIQKRGELSRMTGSFKVIAILMYLIFLGGGICLAFFWKYESIGFTWIAVMVYIPVAAAVSRCKGGKFRWIVDLCFALIILTAGICLTIYKNEDAFLNINALFLGLLLVIIPSFL